MRWSGSFPLMVRPSPMAIAPLSRVRFLYFPDKGLTFPLGVPFTYSARSPSRRAFSRVLRHTGTKSFCLFMLCSLEFPFKSAPEQKASSPLRYIYKPAHCHHKCSSFARYVFTTPAFCHCSCLASSLPHRVGLRPGVYMSGAFRFTRDASG